MGEEDSLERRLINIRVKGPKYLGDDYSSFDKYNINESEFAHCLRYKEYDTWYESDMNTYMIDYTSQEEFNEDQAKEFKREIIRAIKANLKEDESVNLEIHIEDRSGYSVAQFNEKNITRD